MKATLVKATGSIYNHIWSVQLFLFSDNNYLNQRIWDSLSWTLLGSPRELALFIAALPETTRALISVFITYAIISVLTTSSIEY